MQIAPVPAALAALVASGAAAALAEAPLVLVDGGRPACAIVRGHDDAFAAGRLARWFAEEGGARVPVVVAGQDAIPERVPLIVIGSGGSNPELCRLAGALRLDIAPAGLTDQGYVARRLRHGGRDHLLLAGGGRAGALYAVTDLIHWRMVREGGRMSVAALDTRQVPRLRYRWFWNWDHRMDWGGPGRVGEAMGGGGTFSKRPEAFLIDWRRCIDYMADHKFNGLILWGFLRDTHGGVEAARALCRYAAERCVRILPGVGTSGYAGYYFEGTHPYNARTWLAQHPELRALTKDGKPHDAPCPSQKANQDWLDRGARWLFDTFPIGGVNLEMGDFFVCHCADCRAARAAIPSDEPDYYKDMAVSHRVTLKTMRALAPDAWLSYATYTGYTAAMAARPPEFLALIPEDALCQWTLTGMARRWPDDVRPMARHNVGYVHWCNRSTGTADDFYLEPIRDICRAAAAAGFEGLDTYGELSPERPNVELCYLAWEAFLWDPDMTIDRFVEERLAPLYGGVAPARVLREILPLVRTAREREGIDGIARARRLAEGARAGASAQGRARWDRLSADLERHERVARLRREEMDRCAAEARRGRRIAVAQVIAGDEDPARGWAAARAVDGDVREPDGYWLTRRNAPRRAWIELRFAEPTRIDRVAIFHQLNPAHYRSLDYTVSVRAGGAWRAVATVRDNAQAGWVGHGFAPVTADALRLEITRSAHGARMGVGEIEARWSGDDS